MHPRLHGAPVVTGSIVACPVEAAEIRGAPSPSGCTLFTETFLRTFDLDPTHPVVIEIADDEKAPPFITGGYAVRETVSTAAASMSTPSNTSP